jgi:hypothetical protein
LNKENNASMHLRYNAFPNKKQSEVLIMTPYESLANAVVLGAVKDWRDAAKQLRRHPGSPSALRMKEETEAFFLSGRFQMFTSVDGKALLSKLCMED